MSYASFEYQLLRQQPQVPEYAQRYNRERADFPSMPSYDPAAGRLDPQDQAHENWMKDVDMADRGGNKVADFVINRLPDYRQRILSAMGNDDRDLVESIRGEMMGFVDKHRDELQPWANLRHSGEQARVLSGYVGSLLDGSYQDKWATGQTVNGRGEAVGGTTMRAFMTDQSPEAIESRSKAYAAKRGFDLDLARTMTDPNAELHKVFASDKDTYEKFKASNGDLADDDRMRMSTQWTRDKWDLVRRNRDAFAGVDDMTDFFRSWENNFSRTKNGGAALVENAIRAYEGQRRSANGVNANAFVENYANFVNGLVGTKTVTDSKGQTQHIEASSVDRMKAFGLANAALTVGRRLGIGANDVLSRSEMKDMLADQLREIKALGDNGFDIYSVSKSPNEDAAETVMARLGVPGATDRFKYYSDARRNLDSAVLSDNDVGLASIPDTARGRDGKPVSVENAFLRPIEMPVRDALARSISGFREGDEGWGATVERVLGDGEKRKAVKADVLKSLSGIKAEPEVKDALAEAYIGNLTAEKRVSATDVLRDLAGMTVDAKGEATTTKAQELQADQLRLGQTVTVTNPETHLSGTPGAGQVTADRSQTRTLTASGDTRFQAALRANPNLVMPRLDGEPQSIADGFREIGSALAYTGEDRQKKVDSSVIDLLGKLTRFGVTGWVTNGDWFRDGAKNLPVQDSGSALDPARSSVETLIRWANANDLESILQLAAVVSKTQGSNLWLERNPMERVNTTGGYAQLGAAMRASSANRDVPGRIAKAAFKVLSDNGFFPKEGSVGLVTPLKGMNLAAGLEFLKVNHKDAMNSSPTYAALFSSGSSVRDHVDVDGFLAQQQKRRLASSFIAKDSAPAGETPVQKSARNLLQVYDRDSQNVRANNELWTHCLRESGNKPAAAAQMFNSYADYYAQERVRGGKVSADSWLKDITSRHWRYLPVVDKGTGTIRQGVYQRSASAMTDQEFKDYCRQCNATLIRDQVPLQIDQVTFDKFDSEGSVRWFEMQDEGRKAAARKMEYDYKLAYDLAKEGGGE